MYLWQETGRWSEIFITWVPTHNVYKKQTQNRLCIIKYTFRKSIIHQLSTNKWNTRENHYREILFSLKLILQFSHLTVCVLSFFLCFLQFLLQLLLLFLKLSLVLKKEHSKQKFFLYLENKTLTVKILEAFQQGRINRTAKSEIFHGANARFWQSTL